MDPASKRSVRRSIHLLRRGAMLRKHSKDLREQSMVLRSHCLEILARAAARRDHAGSGTTARPARGT